MTLSMSRIRILIAVLHPFAATAAGEGVSAPAANRLHGLSRVERARAPARMCVCVYVC